MDEETAIINSNTRNEKIKNFFINNRKILISILLIILMMILGYFVFSEYKKNQKIKISDQYNSIITEYSDNDKEKIKNSLVDLIYKNDSTYSPLSLYFLIDNILITERPKIIKFLISFSNDVLSIILSNNLLILGLSVISLLSIKKYKDSGE